MSTAISSTDYPVGPWTADSGIVPKTLDALIHRLGDIPLSRVRLQPYPGSATLADVAACKERQGCLCELVEGVLVEKPVGYRESLIALAIAVELRKYNQTRRTGLVSGADGMLQLFANLVRLPDVAFTSWKRFPGGSVPDEAAPLAWPDVAVEVLSPSNTRREMQRKRAEYFAAGTLLVWIVDVDERTVTVYTAPEQSIVLHEQDTLDGGSVLPGFSLPLQDLFAELGQHGPPPSE